MASNLLDNYESRVSDIKNDLFENKMRLDFLEALIRKMESAPLGNIKSEIPEILTQMAHTRILSSSEVGDDDNVWAFEI